MHHHYHPPLTGWCSSTYTRIYDEDNDDEWDNVSCVWHSSLMKRLYKYTKRLKIDSGGNVIKLPVLDDRTVTYTISLSLTSLSPIENPR